MVVPVLVRPVREDDKQLLLDAFARLSERSRYRRFLSPRWQLSPRELRFLTEVDHHDHEALVAIDPRTSEFVGVARYLRSEQALATAELAVVVVDNWQCHGVGNRLADALATRAREEGIAHFSCWMLSENQMMCSLAQHLGAVRIVGQQNGTVELVIDLA
jgi:RimJ/RimL family protein N-acetyltransferase